MDEVVKKSIDELNEILPKNSAADHTAPKARFRNMVDWNTRIPLHLNNNNAGLVRATDLFKDENRYKEDFSVRLTHILTAISAMKRP